MSTNHFSHFSLCIRIFLILYCLSRLLVFILTPLLVRNLCYGCAMWTKSVSLECCIFTGFCGDINMTLFIPLAIWNLIKWRFCNFWSSLLKINSLSIGNSLPRWNLQCICSPKCWERHDFMHRDVDFSYIVRGPICTGIKSERWKIVVKSYSLMKNFEWGSWEMQLNVNMVS